MPLRSWHTPILVSLCAQAASAGVDVQYWLSMQLTLCAAATSCVPPASFQAVGCCQLSVPADGSFQAVGPLPNSVQPLGGTG